MTASFVTLRLRREKASHVRLGGEWVGPGTTLGSKGDRDPHPEPMTPLHRPFGLLPNYCNAILSEQCNLGRPIQI
ncbi:unnamed protein product [Ilex paraguariensis]|uniref:Uncharacterized protein n=1 Tax=Ilex paraguariensis TaxID=185542 RepID=A0ABC8TT23_9AQUA